MTKKILILKVQILFFLKKHSNELADKLKRYITTY